MTDLPPDTVEAVETHRETLETLAESNDLRCQRYAKLLLEEVDR